MIFPYSIIQSCLNLCAGVVPIKLSESSEYISKHNDSISKALKSNCIKTGLPIGFQICTLPYKEEKCLRLMKEIDDLYNFSKNPKNILTKKIKIDSTFKDGEKSFS